MLLVKYSHVFLSSNGRLFFLIINGGEDSKYVGPVLGRLLCGSLLDERPPHPEGHGVGADRLERERAGTSAQPAVEVSGTAGVALHLHPVVVAHEILTDAFGWRWQTQTRSQRACTAPL